MILPTLHEKHHMMSSNFLCCMDRPETKDAAFHARQRDAAPVWSGFHVGIAGVSLKTLLRGRLTAVVVYGDSNLSVD